ncbi:Bro-N domain-containing protein [Bacillus mycoides]|uniref:BRO-N domain-containing protein n=1 Tax=Bacillus mycoides TaxID=1405 RepID=UPI003D22CCE0
MSNQLTVIHQQEVLGQGFKVYGTIEEPLFLAKDVSEWIGHTNLTVMMRLVDEGEKVKAFLPLNNVYPQKGSGGLRENTEANFISEDGIYELLMLSRKPIAKQWKKEVKKILKNIRLNGGHVQVDREEEFIHSHFPSFSEEVKKAMVLEVVDEDEKETHEFTTLNNNYSRERHLITKKTLLTEDGI